MNIKLYGLVASLAIAVFASAMIFSCADGACGITEVKHQAAVAEEDASSSSVWNLFNNRPVGRAGGVWKNGTAHGWAYDPDQPNKRIGVHFYIDGKYVGAAKADEKRNGIDVDHISHNRWYTFTIPAKYWDGKKHRLRAYGIDSRGTGTGNNALLSNNPTVFTLGQFACVEYKRSGCQNNPSCTWSGGKCQNKDDKKNQPPKITSFTGPNNVTVNKKGSWRLKGSDQDSTSVSYTIWWGDGLNKPARGTFNGDKTVNYTYTKAGAFTVTAQLRDGKGATKQVTKKVTVKAVANKPPKITSFTGPSSVGVSKEGTWHLKGSDADSTSVKYTIWWGDGLGKIAHGDFDGDEKVSYLYSKAGIYTITAELKDSQGATKKVTRKVTVSAGRNKPPEIGSVSGPKKRTKNTEGTWTITGKDPDKDQMTYRINWGDGSIKEEGRFNGEKARPHTYKKPGNYNIQIILTDEHGAQDIETRAVEIITPPTTNQPPVIDSFTGPARRNVNERGAWVLGGSDRDSSVLTYEIDWGDNSAKSTGTFTSPQSINHTYDTAGTYTVTAILKDSDNNTDEESTTVVVGEDDLRSRNLIGSLDTKASKPGAQTIYSGWGCYKGRDESVTVNVYQGGDKIRSYLADIRSEEVVKDRCDGNGRYNFNVSFTPQERKRLAGEKARVEIAIGDVKKTLGTVKIPKGPKFSFGRGKNSFFNILFIHINGLLGYSGGIEDREEVDKDIVYVNRRIDELNFGSHLLSFKMGSLYTTDRNCSDITIIPEGLSLWRKIIANVPADVEIDARLTNVPDQTVTMQINDRGNRHNVEIKACEKLFAEDKQAFKRIWEKYVRKIVTEFGDRIVSYDLWVEPNQNGFYLLGGQLDNGEHRGWTHDEYMRYIFMPGYKIIRSLDPSATVTVGPVGAGFSGSPDPDPLVPKRLQTEEKYYGIRDFLGKTVTYLRENSRCDAECRRDFANGTIMLKPHPFTNQTKIEDAMDEWPKYGLEMVYDRSVANKSNLTTTRTGLSRLSYEGPINLLMGRHSSYPDATTAERRNGEKIQAEFLRGIFAKAYDTYRNHPTLPLKTLMLFQLRNNGGADRDAASGLLRQRAHDGHKANSPRPAFFALKDLIFEKKLFGSLLESFDEGGKARLPYWNMACDRERWYCGDRQFTDKDGWYHLNPANRADARTGIYSAALIPLKSDKNVDAYFEYVLVDKEGHAPNLVATLGGRDSVGNNHITADKEGLHVVIGKSGRNETISVESRSSNGTRRILATGSWDRTACAQESNPKKVEMHMFTGGLWWVKVTNPSGERVCYENKSSLAGTRHNIGVGNLTHAGIRLMAHDVTGEGGYVKIDDIRLASDPD